MRWGAVFEELACLHSSCDRFTSRRIATVAPTMSFVQAPSLQALADSMGVPKLSDEAAKALAPDVEYRMRDIIQVQRLQTLPMNEMNNFNVSTHLLASRHARTITQERNR